MYCWRLRASSSKLRTSGHGRPQNGEDLREERPQRGRGIKIVEGGSESRTHSGRNGAPGWPRVAKIPGWIARVMNLLGESLVALTRFKDLGYYPKRLTF